MDQQTKDQVAKAEQDKLNQKILEQQQNIDVDLQIAKRLERKKMVAIVKYSLDGVDHAFSEIINYTGYTNLPEILEKLKWCVFDIPNRAVIKSITFE